jgi:hypothetical protein
LACLLAPPDGITFDGKLATLYWLEVLALPIMGLVGLGLMWGMNE